MQDEEKGCRMRRRDAVCTVQNVNLLNVLMPCDNYTPLRRLAHYIVHTASLLLPQMLEASSSQFSTFIHWYYWSLHSGRFVVLYNYDIIGLLVRYGTDLSQELI